MCSNSVRLILIKFNVYLYIIIIYEIRYVSFADDKCLRKIYNNVYTWQECHV